MSAKIYTKTGDQGTTQLVSGRRVFKNHFRVQAYGNLDELNSILGMCIQSLSQHLDLSSYLQIHQILTATQNHIFTVGSLLSCEDEKTFPHLPPMNAAWTLQLENEIDQMTEQLPALKEFILPGGSAAGNWLHLARTCTRRCERDIVDILQNEEIVPILQQPYAEILRFINRLSDYLFVASRMGNHALNIPETKWNKDL
jgi:cob(I)alamin adenosyltransferase